MSKTVVALFDNKDASERAVSELSNAGISRDRIDISKGYAPDKTQHSGKDINDKDSVSKFFDSLFGTDESDKYSTVARTCGSIVTVHAKSDDEAQKAAKILDDAGAEDIDDLARKCGQMQGHDRQNAMPASAHAKTPGHAADDRNEQKNTGRSAQHDQNKGTSIPVIEENVQLGKREVNTGGVRVRSRIVERPVEETMRLREEHVMIDRQKVNRPATEADMQNFKEGQAEFVEHKEVPDVRKDAKVVEEIRIGKEVNERQEKISETERKTEVDVEKMGRGSERPGSDRR